MICKILLVILSNISASVLILVLLQTIFSLEYDEKDCSLSDIVDYSESENVLPFPTAEPRFGVRNKQERWINGRIPFVFSSTLNTKIYAELLLVVIVTSLVHSGST